MVVTLVKGKPLAHRTGLLICRVRRFGQSQLPLAAAALQANGGCGKRPRDVPRCPVDSGTPPEREAYTESMGESQQSIYRSEDTTVSSSKYVDFSYAIFEAEVA
ncbi:hypothetical protein UY3_09366 [Chelonia mydas]|uniref:Uncharacterized protein n=1 Tax=Chelonia mydas TaxID=8469 RepID=M7BN86_CHEMY|nr:hypothetical protein UY3_09366 [Chelonia mydas]